MGGVHESLVLVEESSKCFTSGWKCYVYLLGGYQKVANLQGLNHLKSINSANTMELIVLSVWKTDNEEKEDGVGHFEKTKWFNQWENQRTWHIITGFLFTVTYEKLECITMQQLEISTWKYVQETYKIWQLDLYPPHRNINLLTFQRSQPFRCLSKDKDGSTTIKSALKRALTKKCRLWFKELQSLFLFGKLV